MSLLRSLYDYQAWVDSQQETVTSGCGMIEFAYLVHIDKRGRFLDLISLIDDKKRGKLFLAPALVQRSGTKAWQIANTGWDYREFVLGVPKAGSGGVVTDKDVDGAKKKLKTFREAIATLASELSGKAKAEAEAILAFYTNEEYEKVKSDPLFDECKTRVKCCLSFKVGDDETPFASRPEVLAYAGKAPTSKTTDDDSEGLYGRCLITGEKAPIARLHPVTNIPGSKSNAKIASWQVQCGYDSYGHVKGENAPVSVKAAEMYGRAFDALKKSGRNTISLGFDTCMYWTLPENRGYEDLVKDLIYNFQSDKIELRSRLAAIDSALQNQYKNCKDAFRLYILTPNAARIAIRSEHETTVADSADALRRHIEDCTVTDSKDELSYWPLNHLLRTLSFDGKTGSLPAGYFGSYIYSVFARQPYPATVYQSIIKKIRKEATVPALMAGAIKGYLIRHPETQDKGEYTMALNESCNNVAYVSGRIFALIEKCVINTSPTVGPLFPTKHFAQTMSSPGLILPQLLKVYQRNISNCPYLMRQIAVVMDMIDALPQRLSMKDQGDFALGYYQQRQALYRKRDNAESDADIETETVVE